jgi:hypothetical protein
MSDLRQELARAADLAQPYGDAAAAIRADRRRRTWRAGVTGAVAALAVVGVVVATVQVGRPTSAPVLPADPSPSVTGAGFWVGQTAMAPAWLPDAPPLPRDRAVGRGALLLFAPGDNGPANFNLLTEDGKQYRLAAPSGYVEPSVRLSPNGRWLWWANAQGSTIRDLTGTRMKVLAKVPVALVSPNGEWMLGYQDAVAAMVVRAADMRVSEQNGYSYLSAILNDGNVLAIDQQVQKGASVLSLAVQDRDGQTVRRLRVDATALLKANESVAIYSDDGWGSQYAQARIVVGDGLGAVQLSSKSAGTDIGSVVVFSLADGAVVRRIDGSVAEGIHLPGIDVLGPEWYLIGFVDGALLTRHATNQSSQLEVIDPVTGELRGVRGVPEGTSAFAPGDV